MIRMRKTFIIVIFVSFFVASCSFEQVHSTTAKNGTANVAELLKKQILLTNYAEFKRNRTLEGASAFLINHKGSFFAVTAKHLLGEAGGVEPEVKINELANHLIKWEMSPRVGTSTSKEIVTVNAKNLDYSKSTNDILLLNVTSDTYNFQPLTPNFETPSIGEEMILIGCPYSETQCKQNSYKATFVEFDDSEALMVLEIKSNTDLRGFSGAPLLNTKGEVVGVLVGGGKSQGQNFVTATHIREIQKIVR